MPQRDHSAPLRQLLILRHGKSDWDTGHNDFDRPLANRGVKAAHRMGRLLGELGLKPQEIITSPARRARTTAEIVAAELGRDDIREDPAIYAASYRTLVDIVSGIDDGIRCALLVGHNPGLEDLVAGLTGSADVVLKTCSLAILEAESRTWLPASLPGYSLRELHHPRELE